MAEPYHADPNYRAGVVAVMSAQSSSMPPVVADLAPPPVTPLRYHHLGLVCRDVSASAAFYSQLGFAAGDSESGAAKGEGVFTLTHVKGLQLHLIQADDVSRDANGCDNVLMDFPTLKHPGHTHASWAVPSVPSVKAFMATLGIEPSGARSTLAIFVRDPDRTTLEFERNDGLDEPPEVFTPDHIADKRPLDHVGVRVGAPYDRHIEWYARHLGFTTKVAVYEPNLDPFKNFRPWVTRSAGGCDINWIINANSPSPAAGEAPVNVLCKDGVLRPGILYVAFAIAELDAPKVCAILRAAGVDALLDTDLPMGWGDFPASAVRVDAAAPTVMVRDLDGNIVRLVPSLAAHVSNLPLRCAE